MRTHRITTEIRCPYCGRQERQEFDVTSGGGIGPENIVKCKCGKDYRIEAVLYVDTLKMAADLPTWADVKGILR